MSEKETTNFGFERVPLADKRRRVGEVFASVANRYDVMNDLMSFGIHRAWKRFAVEVSELRPGQRVLDLAGGTGDLARQIIRRVAPDGSVVLADINVPMLEHGRQRLLDAGVLSGMGYVQADAELLPFATGSFDCVCIAFGLRNVTDKDRALGSAYRVLRPGGKLLVLEFSHPSVAALEPFYDAYSFKILPWLGELVAKDREAYRYLAESIRMHPDQQTLRAMMEVAGFERCSYFNLTAGIVAVHRGYKL